MQWLVAHATGNCLTLTGLVLPDLAVIGYAGYDACAGAGKGSKACDDAIAAVTSTGPSHIGTYMKSQMFQGLLFAKFRNSVDRDTVVALLRSAEMQEKGKRVWATQDLPMMQHVQKVFIMGLRWQLGEWGFMKRDMQWNDKFTNLKVGPDVVVTVRISNQKLVCDWSPEWAQWDDLQHSLELKQLIQRANDKLQHRTASKGSGKSKQSFAGMEASS
eukprot:s7727_g4.t1